MFIGKQEIATRVAEKLQIAKISAEAIIAAVTSCISEILCDHAAKREEVVINLTNFGSFRLKNVPERKAKNPRSGVDIIVPASSKLRFCCSKNLRSAIIRRSRGGNQDAVD